MLKLQSNKNLILLFPRDRVNQERTNSVPDSLPGTRAYKRRNRPEEVMTLISGSSNFSKSRKMKRKSALRRRNWLLKPKRTRWSSPSGNSTDVSSEWKNAATRSKTLAAICSCHWMTPALMLVQSSPALSAGLAPTLPDRDSDWLQCRHQFTQSLIN